MFKMHYYCLLLLISTIHDSLSFYIVVSKREEWKEEALLWSSPGDINIATPVKHAVGCYLAGSKCKPNLCQKVYCCNRPKYFFLWVNSRITSNIL